MPEVRRASHERTGHPGRLRSLLPTEDAAGGQRAGSTPRSDKPIRLYRGGRDMISLSKREARYRTKLIQELHLKKPDQRRLDDYYMAHLHGTFCAAYEHYRRYGIKQIPLNAAASWWLRSPYTSLAGLDYLFAESARVFASVGVSCSEAVKAFDLLTRDLISQKGDHHGQMDNGRPRADRRHHLRNRHPR